MLNKRSTRLSLVRGIAGVLLLVAPLALAQASDPGESDPAGPADAGDASSASPSDVTTVATSGDQAPADASPLSFSVTAATTVGIGTFVEGPQRRELVIGSVSPSVSYKLQETVSVSGGIGATWYAVESAAVGFEPNRVLLGSASAALADGSIWANKEAGLKLSGSFSVVAPTALADQVTNKLFSMTPSMALSWKLGSFTLTSNASFSKHFNRTNQATLDCSGFADASQCPQGRLLADRLTAESSDGQVVLTGAGLTSFSVGYGLGAGYAIIDGLNLSLGLGLGHAFGVIDMPEDELTSVNAKSGRAQSDSLSSSVGLSYQAHKHLSLGLSLGTSTAQPFGAQGDDAPVLFDFTRASDNITTVGLSATGSI
jgi:long-subunit fatty acid transport protein